MNLADQNKAALPFFILALPFFINDFGFIYFKGTYGVYLVNYIVRLYVIMLLHYLADRQANCEYVV